MVFLVVPKLVQLDVFEISEKSTNGNLWAGSCQDSTISVMPRPMLGRMEVSKEKLEALRVTLPRKASWLELDGACKQRAA